MLPQHPSRTTFWSSWLLALVPILATGGDDQGGGAGFACPAAGTVYTLSMPLAMSAAPQFRNRITIAGQRGEDCHVLSEAQGESWLHVGLVDRNSQDAWLKAAEAIWPLKVGKTGHATIRYNIDLWTVDYRVEAFAPFEARLGTFDAYKIVGTLQLNGKPVSTTTRWWAPDLKYTISYRQVRADDGSDQCWEIAAIGKAAPER